MQKKKWFQKAIMEKTPYSLKGWEKTQSPAKRRSEALASRPKNWTIQHKRLSVSRALQSLANVNSGRKGDKQTKKIAQSDANYFRKIYHKYKK